MDRHVRRITAISGVFIIIGVGVSVPLYFIHQGPPLAVNVLTRSLVNIVTCGFMLLFFTGFSQLIRKSSTSLDWVASLALTSGTILVVLTFVAISLETGVVFGTPDGTVDPTVDGPLAHGNILIHGSIKRLVNAIYLIAAGYAIVRSGILPAALGYAGYLIAAFNLFFLPSLYFGTDPSQFYSAHGWGNSALAGSAITYWILGVSLMLFRNPQPQTVAK